MAPSRPRPDRKNHQGPNDRNGLADHGRAGGPGAADRVPGPGGSAAPRVAAVVVTYNRRPLLLESLAAVLGQTRPPDAVLVIDNASTDGTAAAVRESFPAARLTVLGQNTGGAGGFAAGIALALAGGANLIWLMDDDTVPEPTALQALLAARAQRPAAPPVLVASRVVWTDGRPHPMNTPRVKPFATRAQQRAAAAAGCQPIRSASFVSILVDAGACRERGLPQADYFLWNDDFEFTTRLLRGRDGWLCPASLVVHKTATFGSTDTDPGQRFYYEVRNKVWTLRSGGSLAPAERLLYSGATVRRWARTFARSADRATLRSCLRRGLAAGLRTRPRPTADLLAAAGLTIPAGLTTPAGPAVPAGEPPLAGRPQAR
jgi:rhamnopyranosyl-N-acetylglucosaminyl-diphospho-decaprenol beta-1,3/1,4-galactofuranosyltransferase